MTSVIKKCDFAGNSTSTVQAMNLCKSAFGKCRKYEDDVGDIIHACSQDTDAMKKRLKNLSENKKAVDTVLSKIATTVESRANVRDERQTGTTTTAAQGVTDSTSFITYTQSLITLISHDPTDYQIYVVSTQIISSTVTFTSSELDTLSSVSVSLTVAVVAIQYEL